jgi:hypothetical protein
MFALARPAFAFPRSQPCTQLAQDIARMITLLYKGKMGAFFVSIV